MKVGLVAALNINAAYPVTGAGYVPLGILCLAAVLEPAGYKIEILDPNLWFAKGEIKPNLDLENEIAQRVAEYKFDVIGFSTLVNTYHHTLKTVTALKKINKNVPIILGGPQSTHTDIKTLEVFPAVDIIVRGEGEITTLALLESLEDATPLKDVTGITYKENNKVVKNEDTPLIANLNELPFPAYHLYPIEGKTGVFLDAGRGCPYQCNFCSTSIFWKRRFRQKDPARIVEEMEILKNGYNVKSVDFTHDLFTLDKKKVLEFCSIIKEKKLKLPWTCSTRIDAIDNEMLKTMSEAGCQDILFGVESGSTHMQEIIGKGFDVSIIKDKIRETIENKIGATSSFIIGFPEETKEDVAKTINLAVDLLGVSRLVKNSQIHLLAVTSETKLYNQYKDKLLYDGIETDQVSGGLFLERDPIISEFPELFSAHYYLPTPNISRAFLIDLHIFGLLANSMFRWSIVTATKKIRPFELVQKWHECSVTEKTDMSETAGIASEQMKFFAKRMASLARFLKHDPEGLGWRSPIFDTMVAHESEVTKLRTMLLTDPSKKDALKIGDELNTMEYDYDPNAIIDYLTSSSPKPKPPRKGKIKFAYIFAGMGMGGPSIKGEKIKKEVS